MAQVRLCPACRRTRLSRYNHDPLCAACMRASRAVPSLADPGALVWLWDSAPMRDALVRVDLAAVVAVFRAAAGLSQYELADITGWSQSTLSLFETGQRDTLYDVRALLRFADAVDMPREALLPLMLGRSDVALPDAWLAEVRLADVPLADGSALEETGVDIGRRGFGGIAAGTAAAVMLPEISVPTRVTASHVSYLQTCADSLWKRDQAVGGAALLRQAVRQWQHARRMMDEADYSESVGRGLLKVTGNLAVCAGFLAFDAGHVPLSRRLYAEAQLLTDGAGDPILAVHVLEKLSMLASYTARTSLKAGPAREGLRLARQAAEAGRYETLPQLQALIALRHANAASLLGDKHTFRQAVARARREIDRGPETDSPEWIRFVDDDEVTGQEAMGHLNLGDPARAEDLYRSVLVGDLSPRSRTCKQALLAGALARSGDASGALNEGMATLAALEGGVTSVRALNELRPVRDSAEKAREEEFCVRFDAVERALAVV